MKETAASSVFVSVPKPPSAPRPSAAALHGTHHRGRGRWTSGGAAPRAAAAGRWARPLRPSPPGDRRPDCSARTFPRIPARRSADMCITCWRLPVGCHSRDPRGTPAAFSLQRCSSHQYGAIGRLPVSTPASAWLLTPLKAAPIPAQVARPQDVGCHFGSPREGYYGAQPPSSIPNTLRFVRPRFHAPRITRVSPPHPLLSIHTVGSPWITGG